MFQSEDAGDLITLNMFQSKPVMFWETALYDIIQVSWSLRKWYHGVPNWFTLHLVMQNIVEILIISVNCVVEMLLRKLRVIIQTELI